MESERQSGRGERKEGRKVRGTDSTKDVKDNMPEGGAMDRVERKIKGKGYKARKI